MKTLSDLCQERVRIKRFLLRAVEEALTPIFYMGPGYQGLDEDSLLEIAADDKSFDVCFVHDLFEHLSIEAMERAVRETCRVTRGLLVAHQNMWDLAGLEQRIIDMQHCPTRITKNILSSIPY